MCGRAQTAICYVAYSVSSPSGVLKFHIENGFPCIRKEQARRVRKMPDYWIQIENRPWDVCPHNIDRMTGQNLKDLEGTDPVTVTLSSPGTGVVRNNVTMFRPLRKADGTVDDALILRRYKPPQQGDQSDAWTVADDRKVNPWDINEPDPSDSGTMGTIPGPVIECN